jgi:hypothetical protein
MTTPTTQAAPSGTVRADVRHVASLLLPIPVSALSGLVAGLQRAYGLDLTMREEPKGWLKIELPNIV